MEQSYAYYNSRNDGEIIIVQTEETLKTFKQQGNRQQIQVFCIQNSCYRSYKCIMIFFLLKG